MVTKNFQNALPQRKMTPAAMKNYRDYGSHVKDSFVSFAEIMDTKSKNFTKEEKQLLNTYVSFFYKIINNFLRRKYMHDQKKSSFLKDTTMIDLVHVLLFSEHGKKMKQTHTKLSKIRLGEVKSLANKTQQRLENFIGKLDNLYEKKAPRLKDSITLYRGEFYSFANTFWDAPIGSIIEVPSFISTTLDPQSARFFSTFDGFDPNFKSFVNIPMKNTQKELSLSEINENRLHKKGILLVIEVPKGMPFLFIDNITKSVWEKEVLLQRGLSMEILDKKTIKDPRSLEYLSWEKNNANIKNVKNMRSLENNMNASLISWDDLRVVHVRVYLNEPRLKIRPQNKTSNTEKNKQKDKDKERFLITKWSDRQTESEYKLSEDALFFQPFNPDTLFEV